MRAILIMSLKIRLVTYLEFACIYHLPTCIGNVEDINAAVEVAHSNLCFFGHVFSLGHLFAEETENRNR